ncbi:iron-sulfur cluster repair di-iron protein [soil metagenome]
MINRLLRKMSAAALSPEEVTVGQLTIEHPGAVAIFERYGIRYCCRGHETLGEACAGAGLNPLTVLRDLERCDAEGGEDRTDWSEASITEVADHIQESRYGYLDNALPRLESLVNRVANVHGDQHPELVELRRVFAILKLDLEEHRIQEEEVLFPMCRELDAARVRPDFYRRTVRNPISVMADEHDNVALALAELHELAAGFEPPSDSCSAYLAMLEGLAELERRLHQHIHEENNVLFPKAMAGEAALPRW